MSKRLHSLCRACIFVAGTTYAALATGAPPPWAPAHGHRAKQHQYVYYPERQVYYEAERQLWFWLDGGSWQIGAKLPLSLGVRTNEGVKVVLETEKPYEAHDYVVKHYGKGRHKGKDKHGRD
ncbi:hypothetical protein HNQ59_000975 [Chitinivorax tropicus]|uniref:Uncharacterized protein n=1 Tax=Chitinivorax tropicus TaxID=714531 RepID=A0A840MMH2_9PROT|nr:hypothetical protein [Chitinivorax tropicus]MBB5017706.1 hypothetical protein [Chitinivorax tropicus]